MAPDSSGARGPHPSRAEPYPFVAPREPQVRSCTRQGCAASCALGKASGDTSAKGTGVPRGHECQGDTKRRFLSEHTSPVFECSYKGWRSRFHSGFSGG